MEESNYSRGRKYESQIKSQLEKEGYIVFKPVWVKWSKQMDVFNIFDLLAYHAEKQEMLMLQVTTSLDIREWRKRAKKVDGFNLKSVTVACLQRDGQKLEKKYVVGSGV